MRILHLVHQYLPEQVGGTELYTRWLAEELSQQGHDVAIFYRRSTQETTLESRVDAPNLRVWAVGSGLVTPTRRFWATFGDQYILAAFQQVIEEVHPNLVHLQHLMGLPVALAHHLQKLSIPYVITLHDYWWICANAQLLTNYSQEVCTGPQAYLNCARCALARANHPEFWPAIPGLAGLLGRRNQLLRKVTKAAHGLIAPSQFVAEWYKAHNTAFENLQVVPHGLPIPTSLPLTQVQHDSSVRFAYIGGLTWSKGAHLLLEAFNGLEPGGELWIAGDETADPDYIAHLKALASPAVRFLGKLARPAVWETLAQVDVLVVPSLWYETFAFVVSEAFAAGVPVIASRLGPLAERVRHEVDGLLVPPGDVETLRHALRRFLQEPTLLARLRGGVQPGPTIEVHVSEMTAIYKSVVANITPRQNRD